MGMILSLKIPAENEYLFEAGSGFPAMPGIASRIDIIDEVCQIPGFKG
jgi:hypothetical protein